jgi:predicted CoA-binding protein/anti-sigma regulatory factor (Ser/Thr protein kinase)
MAPNLVQAGIKEQDLQDILNVLSASKVASALKWLNASYSITNLLLEISMGTRQISEIVKAMKTYVYLDQAPVQEVDLHEGIENTLVILRSKIKKGVTVHRDYADDLPRITAFGSELNQVWTNILDNAIDAMDGKGEITIHTRRRGDFVVVQLEDNGPGIPDDIQEKIFSPFFTTKPVGKGTGLGLNITWNIIQKHLGDIKVNSRPGKTVFEVYLPINFEKAQDGMIPLGLYTQPDDDTLRQILENTRTIAVVGITDKAELPSYAVPAYLQRQGYRIIPVNPHIQEVLGEKSYTDLPSIPEPIDTVLIFRRSEVVPPIVDEAIKIGAKVVWMQEGIVHEEAASVALDAGLQVVMNTCMRVQHKRLIAKL